MKLALALAAALAALPVADARAECAIQELVPQLLTPPSTTLPADGGVLVGTLARTPVDYQHASRVEDPALTNTWKFQSAGKPVAVDKIVIAPGLVAYRPKSGASVDVLDAKDKKLGAFKRDAATAAAAASVVAPRITKLETTSSEQFRRGRQRTTTATVADPIPRDAFAILVYADGKPISYALVGRTDPKQRTVVAYEDPHACAWNPKGMEIPPTKKQVTLAWVDAFGRVSKQSAPITVTEILPKED